VDSHSGNGLEKHHLVLFMTRGMSLSEWDRNGSLEREIALYREIGKKIGKISIISYGGIKELEHQTLFPGLQILSNQRGMPLWIYERLIPSLYEDVLREASFYKTNQMDGAAICADAAQKFGKPFIARCGYLWSEFVANNPAKIGQTDRARRTEKRVFDQADSVVVTTPRQLDWIIKEHGILKEKCRVIPNYVITDLFKPADRPETRNRICMVGRLDSEKNPLAVINACEGLDVEIVMVGSGPLREEIIRRACMVGVKVEMQGVVPHEKLPDILRTAGMYVMVSPLEGHPKALLEAMACGLPVIGGNSPGIREEIVDGKNGVLCEIDSGSIRKAIQQLLDNPRLRETLSQEARKYIIDNYSLDCVIAQETKLYQELSRVASR
jgi:glycosyltransferase involved in cell wall biosynthesis